MQSQNIQESRISEPLSPSVDKHPHLHVHQTKRVVKRKRDGRGGTLGYQKTFLTTSSRVVVREVLAAEFFRWINISLTPKVRAVTNQEGTELIGIFSKEILGFTPAYVWKHNIQCGAQNLTADDKWKLALLIVGLFGFSENDANEFNWGTNANDQFVKIDHDQALLESSESGFYEPSAHEIYCLPDLTRSTPHNWVTYGRYLNQLNQLHGDENFKLAKYYALTKLILLTRDILMNMAKSHLLETVPDMRQDIHLIIQITISRIDKIRTVLLKMPEFYFFFMKNKEQWLARIEREHENYMCQFMERDCMRIKIKHAHRRVNPDFFKLGMANIENGFSKDARIYLIVKIEGILLRLNSVFLQEFAIGLLQELTVYFCSIYEQAALGQNHRFKYIRGMRSQDLTTKINSIETLVNWVTSTHIESASQYLDWLSRQNSETRTSLKYGRLGQHLSSHATHFSFNP